MISQSHSVHAIRGCVSKICIHKSDNDKSLRQCHSHTGHQGNLEFLWCSSVRSQVSVIYHSLSLTGIQRWRYAHLECENVGETQLINLLTQELQNSLTQQTVNMLPEIERCPRTWWNE